MSGPHRESRAAGTRCQTPSSWCCVLRSVTAGDRGPGPSLGEVLLTAGEGTASSLPMLGQFQAPECASIQGLQQAGLSRREHVDKFSPSPSANITTLVRAWRKVTFVFVFLFSHCPLSPRCRCNEGTSVNETNKNTVIFKIKNKWIESNLQGKIKMASWNLW